MVTWNLKGPRVRDRDQRKEKSEGVTKLGQSAECFS